MASRRSGLASVGKDAVSSQHAPNGAQMSLQGLQKALPGPPLSTPGASEGPIETSRAPMKAGFLAFPKEINGFGTILRKLQGLVELEDVVKLESLVV